MDTILDMECAEWGETIANAVKDEAVITKALGVLQENGVYAFFLFLSTNKKGYSNIKEKTFDFNRYKNAFFQLNIFRPLDKTYCRVFHSLGKRKSPATIIRQQTMILTRKSGKQVPFQLNFITKIPAHLPFAVEKI